MTSFLKNSITGLAIALMVVGCGDSKGDKGDKKEKESKKQVITQKGSDTMILLGQQWAEQFGAKNPDIQVQVTGGGSGTGISSLINGTTDLCNSSRPIKDQEREQIKQKFGSDVVEIPVAKDALSVYLNEANKLESLTLEQLYGIYTGKITNWKAVGGPDARIILYGRENSSGTYEYFKEHVLKKEDFAQETQTLSGTAAVVNAVSKDPNGIGYGGAAFSKGIKEIKIAGADGTPVAPTKENVYSGAYPLSRNLFIYLRQQPTGHIKTYLDWILGPEGQTIVTNVGYYPIKQQ